MRGGFIGWDGFIGRVRLSGETGFGVAGDMARLRWCGLVHH